LVISLLHGIKVNLMQQRVFNHALSSTMRALAALTLIISISECS
jgi:hypothetical protein